MKNNTTTTKVKKQTPILPLDMINTNKETTDMNKMVADYTQVKFGGKYNFGQFKADKEKGLAHQEVCKEATDFHAKHPEMPLYAILMCGVSQGACRHSAFAKGYKNFNRERCEVVLAMAKLYMESMGLKTKPTDVTYRLMLKFYNTVSHDINVLKEHLATAQSMDGKRGHFKELCANIGIE